MDLIRAAKRNNIGRVREYLDRGADPNIIDRSYIKIAPMIAESRGHNDVARLIRDHIRLQRARQRLAFATLLLGNDDLDYDVTSRIADYLHDLDQYGSGKRSSSRRKRKNYTRRRRFF